MGRQEKQVHGSLIIMSLRVYQGCCYVSGYYYAKDRATRSHQTVRARQRCVCIVAYGIWKEWQGHMSVTACVEPAYMYIVVHVAP